nr:MULTISPECIES: hypothetical protein [unclassified Halomonas]
MSVAPGLVATIEGVHGRAIQDRAIPDHVIHDPTIHAHATQGRMIGAPTGVTSGHAGNEMA